MFIKLQIKWLIIILLAISISSFSLLFFLQTSVKSCILREDWIYSGDERIKLEVNFSNTHNCTEISFTNNMKKDISYEPLSFGFKELPTYIIDSNGRFVRKKVDNGRVTFYPHFIKLGETERFYLIYGNDSVKVVFYYKLGQNIYNYVVLES